MQLQARQAFLALALCVSLAPGVLSGGLEEDLGRSEVRVFGAPFPLRPGGTAEGYRLPERLERLGYTRVHERPQRAGEYFWGRETFWVYRREHRWGGRRHEAVLLGLRSDPGTRRVRSIVGGDGSLLSSFERASAWLEPELLAESLEEWRALRVPVTYEQVPERLVKAVLAAEDSRFFTHWGLDAKGIARAALANLKAGRVTQGGSTITQQLVKMRDLTPKRTLGRKASEAVRALALEAEYDKEEILTSYLNHLYYGHIEGVSIYGVGAAARSYFSRSVGELSLQQSALLAAMIQAPNRLSPIRNPEGSRQRRDWVLDRMQDLGWATGPDVERAKAAGLGLSRDQPSGPLGSHFREWVAEEVAERAPRRNAKGRGFVIETELDPELQRLAEASVRDWLGQLRDGYRSLRGAPLGAALVTLDARTGAVLAYVGGDPGAPPGGFDRVREARRQPGSTVKPFVLLEAFESCGDRRPLYPARRVADEPFTLDLPAGDWSPENPDERWHGVVSIREAFRHSWNVPFARIGRWCGYEAVADRIERSGLPMPDPPPPSLTLGSVETTPLDLAGAYTVFATPGERLEPRPVRRIERPGGRVLDVVQTRKRRVVRSATAWLVRDLLRDSVASGTSRAAAIEGWSVIGKTGTSSDRRDAWFAGQAGGLVTVVWLGLDDGARLGLTGGQAAAPLWKSYMSEAVAIRPPWSTPRPEGVVVESIDPRTGLLVRRRHRRAEEELFRRDTLPPRRRFWRRDDPVPVVR